MQEQFNRYCLTKEIASKPSGPVYLAHRINNAVEKVILKVFNTAHFTSEQQCQNFLQMIEKIRELEHSSIVPILDFGVEQGQPYVVRKYLASDSLRQQMDRVSPQEQEAQESLKMILQIGQVLRYAHQHQIIHGNLKPENVFFNSNNEVMISDFGITSFITMTKPQDQSDWETTGYLAPEQCVGTITQKSDQYALGCLTYELLTGHTPSSAQSSSPVISLHSDEGKLANACEETETACENSLCPDYGKVRSDNIRKFGKTRKGTQRWQCKTCRTTWSFSSIETPSQAELLSFSNLVPNLPEQIEETVFKAMAKNPAERYANLSIFLNALQITLLLPTFPFTSSPVPSLQIHIPKLVETMPNEVPVTMPASEHRKQIPNDDYASKDLKLPDSDPSLPHKASMTSSPDTYLPSKTTVTSSSVHFPNKVGVTSNPSDHLPSKVGVTSNPSGHLPNKLGMIPDLDAHLPSKVGVTSNPSGHLPNKLSVIPDLDAHLPSKTTVTSSSAHLPSINRVDALPEGRHSPFNRPLAPTLWLAFALSGIVLLLGTLVLYALVPLQSPASPKLMKNIPTAQPSVQITTIPTEKPRVHHIPIVPRAAPTKMSTQNYIEPSVSNTCNGPGWSKLSNNADPSNNYYVVNIDGNASCYQANWVIPTKLTTGLTCDFTTFFDQESNINVTYTFISRTGKETMIEVGTPFPLSKTFSSLKDIASIRLVADNDKGSNKTMSAGPFTIQNCH